MAVGQTIMLDCDANPTKVVGSKRLLPCLQIMLDGYRKVDPPTRKKLPVQSDVPKLLVKTAYQPGTTQCQQATADLTMIAFYYLLRIGEYTVRGREITPSKWCSSNTRMFCFSRKIAMANSNASRVMLPRISSLLLTATH
jgi:hypothetical protein